MAWFRGVAFLQIIVKRILSYLSPNLFFSHMRLCIYLFDFPLGICLAVVFASSIHFPSVDLSGSSFHFPLSYFKVKRVHCTFYLP